MEEAKTDRTDFLFPKRNFFTGVSTIFSISGETADFNTSNSPEEADLRAIKSDWEMVGQDFKNAIAKLVGENG